VSDADSAELTARLEGCVIGHQLIFLNEATSTNDVAAEMGRNGSAEGVVIFAETQTAGRGRLGRKWESAEGAGLWFSILVRPQIPVRDWGRLTTLAAVAIAEALDEIADCRAQIKWPNDVYLDGKKAVGILIESYAGAEPFAVLGIGVNVNQTHFSEAIAERAVSLRMMAGRMLDRNAVAVAILRRLDAWYQKLPCDFSSIVRIAEARSYLRGRWLEADCAGGRVSGVAENLDENGALVLRKQDGTLVTLQSGEVSTAEL
jgi:BirA family biotin operon repressor/biotin-[acetyl-CoA-carboxylase] ligase